MVVPNDLALWPERREFFGAKCMQKDFSYFQNKKKTVFLHPFECIKIKTDILSVNLFQRTLVNGETHIRKCLMHSESTGNIFCFVCKLFSTENRQTNAFVKTGFLNWKKSEEKIRGHENISERKKCTSI